MTVAITSTMNVGRERVSGFFTIEAYREKIPVKNLLFFEIKILRSSCSEYMVEQRWRVGER